MKKCYRCKKLKDLSAFWTDSRHKDGKASTCGECISKKVDQKEKYKKFRLANPITYLITPAKWRAKKKGIAFDLTAADVTIPEYCPILGIRLVSGKDRMIDSSPSLDRIKPSLGYVKGNVQVVSYRANMLKNNATIDELEKVLKHLKENGC